jgi:beta-N-acetylhexosaminidase
MAGLTHIFSGSNGSGPNGSSSDAEVSAQEAVAAVEAGEDVLCVPPDLDGAYNGLLNAVKQGKISEQRIDASVRKILRMKASVGLERNRFVSLENVAREVADPESEALAAKVSEKAITLVEDKGNLMPVRASSAAGKGIVAVEFTDSARGTDGSRAFTEALHERAPEAKVLHVDAASARYQADAVLEAVRGASTVIVVAESVPSAGRTVQGKSTGSIGLNAGPAQVLESILKAAGEKTIVAAFGNPYAGMGLNGLGTYVCTFTNTPTSAKSLVRAIFGEIPVQGRLPITLPGLADRGAGLDREVSKMQAAK